MGVTVVLRSAELPSREEPEKSGKRGRKKRKPVDDGRVRHEILSTDGRATVPLVHVERELPPGGAKEYRAARKQGVRSFAMWSDPFRQHPYARVVTAAASKGQPAYYDVYGATGEHVGRIIRERAFSGHNVRTRWTVQQPGMPVAVGHKGRMVWWCLWWLFAPVQTAILIAGLVAGGGDGFHMPRRVRYFAERKHVLDYGSSFQTEHLGVVAEDRGWDPRILAALTALHSSHEFLGDAWDTRAVEPAATETANPAETPATSQ